MQQPSQPFLITGATGFSGGHLARYLRERGIPVRALVRNSANCDWMREIGIELAIGDLTDKRSLVEATRGVRGIYHLAAAYRVSTTTRSQFFAVNLEGTRNIFEAAIAEKVRRLIHCSTIGVTSTIANPPGDENLPYHPTDAYQESKIEAEKLALEYYSSGKIRGVVLRPAAIYGPGDTRLLKLFKLVARKKFFFVGSGNNFIHFIHVRDLARAFELAMDKESLNAQVFIIAGKEAVRLREVANFIADECHVRRPWLHIPAFPLQALGSICELICTPFGIQPPLYRRRVDFFIKNRAFLTTKASHDLGFYADKSWQDEVREILSWYQKSGWV